MNFKGKEMSLARREKDVLDGGPLGITKKGSPVLHTEGWPGLGHKRTTIGGTLTLEGKQEGYDWTTRKNKVRSDFWERRDQKGGLGLSIISDRERAIGRLLRKEEDRAAF